MGLFNIYSNHTMELSQKQMFLEFGNIFTEGETIEKAVKLDSDKFILTNQRLFLILTCKGDRHELLSIPYWSIRKFSMTRKASNEDDVELNIYLQHEEKPIKKTIRNTEIANEIYRILATYLFNAKSLTTDFPLMKFN